jgi:diguanylate cyclase (GGDEF)-like protein/PAS domain S-box-containing protein
MLLRSIRSRMLGLVIATVVPFTALIGAGLWNQWRNAEAAASRRALEEARLLAAQVDDHIGNLDNLMTGLSRAVSWDPADAAKNDAMLRDLKGELPGFISNVVLYSLDGTAIGTSLSERTGRRNYAAHRTYFQQVIAGAHFAIGEVVRASSNDQWVIIFARPIHDQEGRLQAVLAVGTRLERFQEALRVQGLPAGSVVRIVNEHGIVIAQSPDGPNWIGRDLTGVDHVAQHLAAKEVSEVTRWGDDVERITGSSTAHLAPWLVTVGLPTEIAAAGVVQRVGWGALFVFTTLLISSAIAWMLSGRIVGPLRQLHKDASKLAAGELSHRSAVRTHDEVGILADTFNRMATRLEGRRQEAHKAADDLRQAKDTLAAVIDASPVAIVCSDTERRIFLWSRSAEEIFGYTADEVSGKLAHLVPPPRVSGNSQGLFERLLKGETIRNMRLKRLRKDGSTVDVRIAAAPMYNPDGTIWGVARAYEDITEYVRAEEQLERVAHYDQLTGLPNRLTLQKELGRLLSGDGGGKPAAIALFDLDGFKDVNDTLGHSTGDQLLVEVGQRLSDVTASRGQVCRLGGDEFVVIIPGCGDPLAIDEIVGTMLERLAEPYKINEHTLHIAGSAGIAIAPNDGASVDELIANADLALYQAKSDGGHARRFFLPVLRAQAQARRSLDLDLRRAFAENEFELYFQPQIRLADEAVVGAEALIRWRHPERGILAPGAFIDTLAASPIAPEVSRWIIRTACAMTSQWRAAGLRLGRIGVNLFPTQLGDDALLKDIDDALRATGLPAQTLELEITENVALNFADAAVLQKLREKGIKLAFDDFGTGYASLSYLTRFPLARIKIDRSFVAKITDDAGDAAIVRSLIAMAHNLGLEVIAEGVETHDQAGFLLKEQCEEAQGFLYAKPLPAADFEAYLRTRSLASAATSPDRPISHDTGHHRRAGKASGRRKLPTA